MNQQRQEMLSALFDGQTSEFETRRLLAELNEDDRKQLRQYQLIQDAYQKRISKHHHMDISQAVSMAIAQEDIIAANKSKKFAHAKPFLGFTAAAAFAFVAVFGAQQYQHLNNSDNGFVADGNVSASQIPLANSPGLSTASGVSLAPLPNESEKEKTAELLKQAQEKAPQ